MPSYLAETFHPGPRAPELVDCDDRARAAAAELTEAGTPVRYVRSIYVPQDEICFFVFEAVSADAVGAACKRASLRFERIVRAIDSRKETS